MPNRHYSIGQRLAGAVLARLKGTEAAADELKMDRRTIRRWLAAAPEDGWTLARDLAQARLQEALATGRLAPSQLATIAGIAERNVRYGELLRQREQRKAAEAEPAEPEPDEVTLAVRALRDVDKRDKALDAELRTRYLRPPPTPTPQPAEPAQEPSDPIALGAYRQPSPVTVLPFGEHLEDHPSWRPAWSSDNP
jgi:hypothetical protein